jgi:SM-20-related protein
MRESGSTKMHNDATAIDFNLFLRKEFFDEWMRSELIAGFTRAPRQRAAVYNQGETGSIDERMRKTARIMPSSETVLRIRERLSAIREEIGAHFKINLRDCEEPQFLHYRTGDFFVAHQDGGTGLMLSEREQSRKISLVIFLNRQSEEGDAGAGSYAGGSLIFSEWRPGRVRGRYALAPAEAGMLVAFPSDTTHEVTPVTRGERYTIVSWFVG